MKATLDNPTAESIGQRIVREMMDAMADDERGAGYGPVQVARAIDEAIAGVKRGIAFHVETAQTQARMAQNMIEETERPRLAEHVGCVIEQLQEIQAKLKKEG